MKIIDVIFALVFGRVIGFLMGDFLREWGINIGFYWSLVIWLAFPMFSLFCLWIAFQIGKKLLFVFQTAKFLLIGAVATVIDLKVFEFLFWVFSIYIPTGSIIPKSISFIFATSLKYWGNKYWAFQKHEKENMQKEILHFFSITLIGLIIDVASFYFFAKIIGSQFSIPPGIWIKLSVIFAGLTAASWNFLGYKFLVFKK